MPTRILVVVCSVGLVGCAAQKTETFQAQPKGPQEQVAAAAVSGSELELHFVKVGQGDCTLIKCPNGTNILVDAGSLKERKPLTLRKYLNAQLPEPRTIHTLVLTHPGAGHYNLMPYCLQDITVEQVLMVGSADGYGAPSNVDKAFTRDDAGFRQWLEAHPNRRVLDEGDVGGQNTPSDLFDSGDVAIHVIAAGTDGTVLMVTHGEFDVLLTGDATPETRETILGAYDDWWLDADVLKIGHDATPGDWADIARPGIAIVSVSHSKNQGHPHHDLRAKLEPHTQTAAPHRIRWWRSEHTSYDIRGYDEAIYSTATNKNIVLTSDGSLIEVRYGD